MLGGNCSLRVLVTVAMLLSWVRRVQPDTIEWTNRGVSPGLRNCLKHSSVATDCREQRAPRRWRCPNHGQYSAHEFC